MKLGDLRNMHASVSVGTGCSDGNAKIELHNCAKVQFDLRSQQFTLTVQFKKAP